MAIPKSPNSRLGMGETINPPFIKGGRGDCLTLKVAKGPCDFLASGKAKASAGHLVLHHLHAAMVYAGLKGAHQVVGE